MNLKILMAMETETLKKNHDLLENNIKIITERIKQLEIKKIAIENEINNIISKGQADIDNLNKNKLFLENRINENEKKINEGNSHLINIKELVTDLVKKESRIKELEPLLITAEDKYNTMVAKEKTISNKVEEYNNKIQFYEEKEKMLKAKEKELKSIQEILEGQKKDIEKKELDIKNLIMVNDFKTQQLELTGKTIGHYVKGLQSEMDKRNIKIDIMNILQTLK